MRLKRKHIKIALWRLSVSCICLHLVTWPAFGQEFRGSITGRVTDVAGATVAGARVTVTNVEMNTSTTARADEDGNYSVFYLLPGRYSVTAEAQGFKKLVQQGIEVRVADKLALDLSLEVGGVQEAVNITARAALLETTSSSAGQVIDGRRISELPLSDGNPFVLSRLVPGVAYTGDLKFSRPFDNAGTSAIVADGAAGANLFALDGSPNMASGGRIAFVPPADAVQEFKVETASFDAQQGLTAGANVNVTTKSGTNELRGTLYEFVRNDKLSANDFFLNRAGRQRDALRYNRYGGSVGGPVWLPKLYNGRTRTFFFFAYEGLKDVFPEPGQFIVPTEAERRGDFSALLSQGIVIFNPFTGGREGSRIRRTPFTNNVITPNLINPVALNYLKYYPLPNAVGDAQGRNNYVAANPRSDTFHTETYRFDHRLTDKQSFFFRYAHNSRRESRNNWGGIVNDIRSTGNFLFRINNAGTYDHVYTISATTVLNFRIGFSRFNEPSLRQHEGIFDPASLGFSQQTAAFFGDVKYLPRFEIGGFSQLGDSIGGGSTFNVYSFQPTLTKIKNGHTMRMGYAFAAIRDNGFGAGHAAGRYDFGTNFTRGPLDNSSSAAIGQELASFLLGLPTGGIIDRNAARANQTLINSFFFQDDWKVTRNLSLNLGLRYEYEAPTNERYNRNTRGFDAASPSPIETEAKAAYAANPDPALSPADFKVRGGLLYADKDNRGFTNVDKNNFMPRVGLAYRIGEKTVVRGGWGTFTVPFGTFAVNQTGFSRQTPIVATLDGGLTFAPECATCATLVNPFPNGLLAPLGADLGLSANLGQGITIFPSDRKNGQAMRWEIGVQREMPGQWLVEGAYVGNKGFDLTSNEFDLNAIPAKYLSRSNVRDQAVIDFLGANIANPFQGLIPGTGLNGSTISRGQLLRPFPQFTSINTRRYDGSSIYHSAQFRGEKRFTKGYTLLASYTWSRFTERVSLLNPTDSEFEQRLSEADIAHRIVVSGIWELPFGRGRAWGSQWHSVINGFLGGWQVQGIFQGQTGRPVTLGNVYFAGDPKSLKTSISGNTVDGTFDTSGFYFHDAAVQTNGADDLAKQRNDSRIKLANNLRTLPSRFDDLRGQGLNLWDLSLIKSFSITERVRFQVRGEFLNAFNHAEFGGAVLGPTVDPTSSNFAKMTNQFNLPRNIQIGLKLLF